ncbi:hypothetical protein KJ865_15565, partial [Myxococcota bacterium]|nr:hypothetical protein [Myxococcota bacterium]
TGFFGTMCRIAIEPPIVGFARCDRTKASKKSKQQLTLTPHIVPPAITLDEPPPALTKASSIVIRGNAYHPESIKDFYILVTNFESENGRHKVFFAAGKGTTIPFTSTIPLEKGLNHILLVARHDAELRGHYLFSVVKED